MLIFAVLSLAHADEAALPEIFAEAAREQAVPEKLLLALAWEASHWRAEQTSAWGGYGLFDLREEIEGPSLEAAALASGLSPDQIIASPEAQVRAVAALLAEHGRRANGGVAPGPDELLSWWTAVTAFSGRHEPNLQYLYAAYIYETINFGLPLDAQTGLSIEAEPVDHWDRVPVPPPTDCDYAGCYQFVSASSANYTNDSRSPGDINYIIIHTVQGSYSGCISWFQNSSASVSAHYVVRSSDGQVTQMVSEADIAWHAGNWTYNEQSVGIEHEGYVDEPETWYTDDMYAGSAALSCDVAARTGMSVDRSHIIGHVEVPGATHTDPGDGWDWDYYMELVAECGGTSSSTGDVIGVIADSDIYTGDRLSGATVWIEETGEVTESDGTGYYYFYDLPLGDYTIHACLDGYAEATCSKSLSSGDNWCSIALMPGEGCSLGGGTDGGTDGGSEGGTTGGTDGATDGGADSAAEGGAGDGAADGGLDTNTPDGGSGAGGEGADGGGPNIPEGSTPGDMVKMDDTRGCSTGGALPGLVGLGLGLLGLLRRRR